MKYKLLLFVYFFSVSFGYTQNKRLSFGIEEHNSLQTIFANNHQIELAYFFYQGDFTVRGKISESKFIESIKRRIPNNNQSGLAVIDWEDIGFQNLIGQKDNSYKKYLDEFIQVIKIAQKARPQIKWAFYGFPIRNFWNTNSKWRKKSMNLSKLYKIQDFIAPSIYLFYLEKEVDEKKQNNYLESNTKLALEIGEKYNKPVHPIIWQRVHNSNPKSGFKNIDHTYFNYYIKSILNVRYKSKSINGIIWWQAENYQHRQYSKSNNILKLEYESVENIDKYQLNLLDSYYREFNKLKFK